MKTFLFLGDSITDSHRLWQPENGGLGDGYVKMLSGIAAEKHFPAAFINKGHDGFTLPSLLRKLPIDCYPSSPDFITILIGINDIAVSRNCGFLFPRKHLPSNTRSCCQKSSHIQMPACSVWRHLPFRIHRNISSGSRM